MANDPITAVADLASTVVSRIWPDKTEEEKAQLTAALTIVQGQLDINKVEATNPSLFVSGARPAAIWVCNFGLAYSFIIYPFASWYAKTHGMEVPPNTDMGTLITMLGSLLGLGALRSVDKYNGVANK